ncbi:hypothetical protein LIA77_09867 [Sarocladium implicatum]|nr:hypothetical protein LIA77_09867 [Sarocladium implicatum]
MLSLLKRLHTSTIVLPDPAHITCSYITKAIESRKGLSSPRRDLSLAPHQHMTIDMCWKEAPRKGSGNNAILAPRCASTPLSHSCAFRVSVSRPLRSQPCKQVYTIHLVVQCLR